MLVFLMGTSFSARDRFGRNIELAGRHMAKLNKQIYLSAVRSRRCQIMNIKGGQLPKKMEVGKKQVVVELINVS